MGRNNQWIVFVAIGIVVVSYILRHQVRSLVRQVLHQQSSEPSERLRTPETAATPETIQSAVKEEYNAAVKHLKAGDKLGAEETIHAAVKAVGSKFGTNSPSYARALSKESSILAHIGDLKRAADACRAAAAVPPVSFQDKKDRLTYQMNLGEFLTHLGEFKEAETVLRESLEERKDLYGTKHPGYAYGLESLADLLLNCGNPRESLALLDSAIAIYRPIGHRQLPFSLALRAFAIKAADGPTADPFPAWGDFPRDLRENIVNCCMHLADLEAPKHTLLVLQDLRRRVVDAQDIRPEKLLDMTIGIANTARLTGDTRLYAEGYQEVVRLCSKLDDRKKLVSAYQALAMAVDETGDHNETERTYQKALEEAIKVGDKKLTAGVLRNYAIWKNEQGQGEAAEQLHRQAVENADASDDKVAQGRTLCAYGIFLQHVGKLDQAKPLLEKALTLLPASDRDAFYAQAHRDALLRNEKCACGSDETLSALIQRLVQEGAPEGLVKSVAVKLKKGQAPNVKVETNRRPSQAEGERLNSVINQAIVEMKREYRRSGLAR